MTTGAPLVLWFRRDLRLADHPMLAEAVATGRPLIPVFVHDDVVARAPAAPRWRWGLAVERFAAALGEAGSRLTLRAGPAAEVLVRLAGEVGAADVWWSRLYDGDAKARDRDVTDALERAGLGARAWPGHLLFEPWTIETKAGRPYSVYSPMWRAVRGREVAAPEPAPERLRAPDAWPESDALADWRMGAAMRRGAEVVARHVRVGEAAARERLDAFLEDRVDAYDRMRDVPATDGTSGLSENLTYGEIGPRTVWHAARAGRDLAELSAGEETFLKELVWREFAYHLLHHAPDLPDECWRKEWRRFPWREDNPDAEAWRRGRTGIRLVDAAMREIHVKGTMHNRSRLVVASYLVKHLMTHWRVGHDFFADHLIDWDVANNALNWQWVAGCGPDASPFFRVFNPEGQLKRFDPKEVYVRRWVAELADEPSDLALSFYDATPRAWGLGPDDPYPEPVVGAAEGRERALAAFAARDF